MSSIVMTQTAASKTVSRDAVGRRKRRHAGARPHLRGGQGHVLPQGIRAVGVESIVAAAGATKMSLYRSFPSKDDLVVAYLKDRDAMYWQWWNEIMDRHAGDPRAQLRALFESVGSRTTRAAYRGCPFTNAATEFPDPDHPGREVAAENKRELRARLRGLAAAIGARDPAVWPTSSSC